MTLLTPLDLKFQLWLTLQSLRKCFDSDSFCKIKGEIFPAPGGETGPDSGQPFPGAGRAMRWEDLEQALQESTSRGLYQSVVKYF